MDWFDGIYCFCLYNDWVYYVSEKIMKLVVNIFGDKLVLLGICFGKFIKIYKFWLYVIVLDYFVFYVKYKVWIKFGVE